MAQYQLTANEHTILRVADGAFIPDDPANRDWQQYQQFLDDGGVPDPAPPPSQAGVIAQSAQSLQFADARQLNSQGRTQDAVAAILDLLE